MRSMLEQSLRAFILVGVAWAATFNLQAQDSSENPFQFTGFAGVSIPDVADEFEEGLLDVDEEVVFGGRFEYRFRPKWGVEGSVGFSPLQADVIGEDADVELDSWDITGNIVYHFLGDQRLDPFVTGGGGVRIIDVIPGETESFFSGNAGGGFQYWINDHWAVRGEGRYFFFNVDEGIDNFDETISDLQVTGGVTFAF